MEISISRSGVFKEVERQSAFIGYSASADGSLFNHICATEDDNQFMYNAWNDGMRICVQLLYKYIDGDLFSYKITGDDDSLVFNISASARFNEGLLQGVASSMELMLASNILYRWLVAKAPEIAPSYQPYVEHYSNGIVLLLSQRKSPIKYFDSNKNIDIPSNYVEICDAIWSKMSKELQNEYEAKVKDDYFYTDSERLRAAAWKYATYLCNNDYNLLTEEEKGILKLIVPKGKIEYFSTGDNEWVNSDYISTGDAVWDVMSVDIKTEYYKKVENEYHYTEKDKRRAAAWLYIKTLKDKGEDFLNIEELKIYNLSLSKQPEYFATKTLDDIKFEQYARCNFNN